MSKWGAKRIAPAGYADAAKGNLYGEFEDWLDASLWTNLSSADQGDSHHSAINVEISTNARATSLRYDVNLASVTMNRVLTSGGEPTKCHMEIDLPSDTTYECGDYLAVLPLNAEKHVKQIMAHFGLPWDAVVTVRSTGPSIFPANTPLSVFEILRSYVELSQPATKKVYILLSNIVWSRLIPRQNLKTLALYANDAKDKEYLENLANDSARFDVEITQKRTSMFDILIHHPSIKLPFGEFLNLLPPLHVRHYSISSSPLENPNKCSLTYGVIDAAALSDPEQRFEGVAGHYLQSLKKGDSIQVSVKPSAKKTFRLPLDTEQTPLLMFAAGTGLAPFRGFLQQRAIQMEANPDRKMAPAILFMGCRSQTCDRLYADQMDEWIKKGVVDVRYAFSKEKDASKGCAYVPERMVHDAEEIVSLWRNKARVYLCGTRKFGDGVRDAAAKIALTERDRGSQRTEEKRELENRFREAMQERVASDLFD